MGWWMLLPTLLLLALLVVGVIVVVRALASGRDKPPRRGTGTEALRILEERYARGEIEERDFEERRRTLRSERAEE